MQGGALHQTRKADTSPYVALQTLNVSFGGATTSRTAKLEDDVTSRMTLMPSGTGSSRRFAFAHILFYPPLAHGTLAITHTHTIFGSLLECCDIAKAIIGPQHHHEDAAG